MRHEDHGDRALSRDRADELDNVRRNRRVEAHKRLVEDDQPLALCEDLSERRATKHAAAQLPGHLWPVGAAAETNRLERGYDG